MPRMPHEPEAFADRVAAMLRSLQPDNSIQLVGPRELIVNGRRLDLENLARLVNRDPDRGTEIVEHYLEHLFSGESALLTSVNFEFAKPRIMPRIQPESIFSHLSRDQVAHVPFVNGTVIVFVLDMPHMTVSITTEQMVQWGTNPDDLEQIARTNLERYAPELSVQVVESREGGKAAIVSEQDGYDAARLLLGSLHKRLSPQLGGDFYVATPARDMFVALTGDPEPFLRRLVTRVQQDYRRLPYPITDALFFVTRDGVAGTAKPGDAEAA